MKEHAAQAALQLQQALAAEAARTAAALAAAETAAAERLAQVQADLLVAQHDAETALNSALVRGSRLETELAEQVGEWLCVVWTFFVLFFFC